MRRNHWYTFTGIINESAKILELRKPKYFIFENVPFIAKHDNEETWNFMQNKLAQLGYKADHKIYSPQDFGITQHRKGCLTGLEHFSFTDIDDQKTSIVDINQFIETNPKDFKALPKANQDCIKLWQTFIDQIPKDFGNS